MLKAVCRDQGVTVGDVVSGVLPLADIAQAIREEPREPTIGSLMQDALRFCIKGHRPHKLLFVVPSAYGDYVADFETVRYWLKSEGLLVRQLSYVIVRQLMPRFSALRLTCVDYRVTPALEPIESAHTAWMRLPGIEGLLARDATRDVVIGEVRRLMTARGTSNARVAADPHEDCLARRIRHGNGKTTDAGWLEDDLRVMRAEHAAANAALQDAGLPCLNEDGVPKRAFRLKPTMVEFVLQGVD